MLYRTQQSPDTAVEALLDKLPQRAKVLDLGCGDGRNSLFVAGHGHVVVALDKDPVILGTCRTFQRHYGSPRMRHHAVCGDLLVPPLPPEMFDAVICTSVLYYLPEHQVEPALMTMYSLVKPGGVLLLSAYTGTPTQRRISRAGTLIDGDAVAPALQALGAVVLESEHIRRPLREYRGKYLFDSRCTVVSKKPDARSIPTRPPLAASEIDRLRKSDPEAYEDWLLGIA